MHQHASTHHFSFFNGTPTTEIYTLSLHDALPIYPAPAARECPRGADGSAADGCAGAAARVPRSEEHTSELQSPVHLVCRLLLEKKNMPLTRLHASLLLITMYLSCIISLVGVAG